MENITLDQIIDEDGVINSRWSEKIWNIGSIIGSKRICYRGSMVSSQEYIGGYDFLDGGIGPVYKRVGTGIKGDLALAYVLYHLNFDPKVLMKKNDIPSLEGIEKILCNKINVQILSDSGELIKTTYLTYTSEREKNTEKFHNYVTKMVDRRSQFQGVDCYSIFYIPYKILFQKIKRPNGRFQNTPEKLTSCGKYITVIFKKDLIEINVESETLKEEENKIIQKINYYKENSFENSERKVYVNKVLPQKWNPTSAAHQLAYLFFDLMREPVNQKFKVSSNIIVPKEPWMMNWEKEANFTD